MSENPQESAKKFGSIEVPADWEVDPGGRFAKTTKDQALGFFDEKYWERMGLQEASIQVLRGKKAYFVTGGWASHIWSKAENVIIQEIASYEQIEGEFSRDLPEGVYFVRKFIIPGIK